MDAKQVIFIDQSKCIGCGMCNKVCTRKLFTYESTGAVTTADDNNCMKCNQCVAICPVDAIKAVNERPAEEFNSKTMTVDPENMLGQIKFRRSTRAYRQKPIPREIIERVLEAGDYAPKGNNRKVFRFIVIDEKIEEYREAFLRELKEVAIGLPAGSPLISAATDEQREAKRQRMMQFYDTYKSTGMDRLSFNAPCMVIILADKTQGGRPLWDSGITCAYMEMQAVAEGLGLCYLGFSMTALEQSDALKKKIGMRENEIPAGIFVMGYPDYQYHRTAPRDETETVWL